MKRIFKFLGSYKLESIVGPLLKLIEATLELIVPLVIAKIIDVGIASSDKCYTVRMSLLLVLLGAVGLICAVAAQYFAAKASVGVSAKMRGLLFARMQSFSYSDIDTLGTSTMITRITSDIDKVQSGLNLGLRLLLRSPFVVFGAMIMAFTIDIPSALTFAAVIPALSIVVYGIMLISVPLHKKVQSGLDSVLHKTRESQSGARVVRAFSKENEDIESFDGESERLMHSQTTVGGISALLNPLTYVLINLAIVWLIHIGAIRVDEGMLTQGEVVALYNYMSQILIELIKLANLIVSITKAIASSGRVCAIIDMPKTQSFGDIDELPKDAEAVIDFRSVAFRYARGSTEAVEGISFTAGCGEKIGIIGGTGSGKSTLINMIPRYYDATAGEVLICGIPIEKYTKDALRKAVGIVPQRAILFSGTVRENMLMGNPNATDAQINEALRAAQIFDTVAEKGGLDAEVAEGGKNFSGGQRQRLTVARALVKKPKILILDDAASALDFATEANMRHDIAKYSENTTTVTVSQRTSSVMGCDKILVLEDGELVGIGTHSELMDSCEIYREIHLSQFGDADGQEKSSGGTKK